jgi:hypothetical protein
MASAAVVGTEARNGIRGAQTTLRCRNRRCGQTLEFAAQPEAAGAGIAWNRTSKGGEAVEERPVTVPDFLATVCRALGIDPTKTNESNIGRPIPITDEAAKPIKELLPG